MRRILIVLSITVIAVCFNSCSNSRVLGNIDMICSEEKTSTSEISFDGKTGDTVKVSLQTEIECGTVNFVLVSSDGRVVSEFDKAKALETYVELNGDGIYTLIADYSNFKGSFNAKVENNE